MVDRRDFFGERVHSCDGGFSSLSGGGVERLNPGLLLRVVR